MARDSTGGRRRRAAPALVAGTLALAALLAAPRPARAAHNKAYWLVSFIGGVLAPLGTTADQRESGLAVGARLGFTAGSGLGVAMVVDYSPLPVRSAAVPADRAVVDNHLVTVALAPRFTLGHGTYRMWLSGGGGALVERTTTGPTQGQTGDRTTDQSLAPAALGELGLETHFFDSGGLVVTGSYLRSFGTHRAQLAAVLGGLVFTFH